MADSTSPEKANPPLSAPIRAVRGHFDWVRMHPLFATPESFNSSLPQTADRRVAASSIKVPAFEHISVGTSTTPQSASAPSKSSNLAGHTLQTNIRPINAQAQNYASSHETDWMGQFRSSSSTSYRPTYRYVNAQSEQMPTYQALPQSTSRDSPSNNDPNTNLSERSAFRSSRKLRRGGKQRQKSYRARKGRSQTGCNSPSPDATNWESIDPKLIEFDAETARQRSRSRAALEDAEIMEEGRLDDVSSDDEDYLEWRADLERKRNDKELFQAIQKSGRRRDDIKTRGGFRGLRGPRKAAEPTGDIKARLGEAAKAFLTGKYEEAREICAEVIRINAETHEAWTTTASCFLELGQRDKALTAFGVAAHLQPKIIQGWLNLASLYLEENGKNRASYLSSAHFCYGAALRADSKHVESRLGKARIYLEWDRPAGAISQYNKVLEIQPRNLVVIRDLCAAYYDNGDLDSAAKLYKETFAQFVANRSFYGDDVLDWADLNSYIAIYQQLDQHSCAIKELKLISRWMLQRDSGFFWNEITEDDREWDVDDSRRSEVPGFIQGDFPPSTYGDGLPLELRIKLGISRLGLGQYEEAIHHFKWLKGPDEAGVDKALSYFDLYRQVADALQTAQLYRPALGFYEPLKQIPEENTGDLHLQMGYCFKGDSLQVQAEECFQTAIQLDEENVEARMELAKMYESLNEQEQAFIYVNEVMSIQSGKNAEPLKQRKRGPRKLKAHEPFLDHTTAQAEEQTRVQTGEAHQQASDNEDLESPKNAKHKARRLANPTVKLADETSRAEQLQIQYRILRGKREDMQEGNRQAARAWMTAARELTDDFRSVRSFYPYDKYVRFVGYRAQESAAGAEVPLDDEATLMAERLSKHLGADIADKTRVPKIEIPEDYRGIPFNFWLDIFLDFALCLARHGRMKESYEMCEAAKDCALWYHDRDALFLIHLCWLTCALFLCDEETCCNTARYFMKDYQFTTDSYRMFTSVTRMVNAPVSWYSAGPSQKFILRQIKAMDYSLIKDPEIRAKHFGEKGSYSAVDENGQLIINEDLDIALLMLYGHILYSSSSYIFALNYFLRALALDPSNPMINLNVGLAYVHYALRRQADNRQYLILQGFTFMFNYYEARKSSPNLDERQEAHYNIARVYHMLGITNLAIPYYELVFRELEDAEGEMSREDLVTDAAYNLQFIYATAGNEELALKITRKWLVI